MLDQIINGPSSKSYLTDTKMMKWEREREREREREVDIMTSWSRFWAYLNYGDEEHYLLQLTTSARHTGTSTIIKEKILCVYVRVCTYRVAFRFLEFRRGTQRITTTDEEGEEMMGMGGNGMDRGHGGRQVCGRGGMECIVGFGGGRQVWEREEIKGMGWDMVGTWFLANSLFSALSTGGPASIFILLFLNFYTKFSCPVNWT